MLDYSLSEMVTRIAHTLTGDSLSFTVQGEQKIGQAPGALGQDGADSGTFGGHFSLF